MADIKSPTERYKAIADAIREKNGTTELMQPADMPQAILDIVSGGDVSGGGGVTYESITFVDKIKEVDTRTYPERLYAHFGVDSTTHPYLLIGVTGTIAYLYFFASREVNSNGNYHLTDPYTLQITIDEGADISAIVSAYEKKDSSKLLHTGINQSSSELADYTYYANFNYTDLNYEGIGTWYNITEEKDTEEAGYSQPTLELLDKGGVTHTMTCEFDGNGKLINATYDDKLIELTYDGDNLVAVGGTAVDIENAPTEPKTTVKADSSASNLVLVGVSSEVVIISRKITTNSSVALAEE